MSSEIKVDTISENTSANGVSIDGLTIKDGGITATTGNTVFNEAGADIDFRVESDNNTHAFFVQGSNGVVGFGTSTLNTNFNVAGGAEFTTTGNVNNFRIISTDDGSATAPDIVFVKDSASPADGDFLGRVDFRGDDSAGNETNFISLFARANVVTNGSEQGALTFTDGDGGNSLLHIQNTEIVFNQDSIDMNLRVESNGLDDALVVDAGTDFVGIGCKTTPSASNGGVGFVKSTNSRMEAVFATTTTGGNDLINFVNGNGVVGKVTTSGSGTTFSTTSDYRLKENVNYDFDATTELKKLKPAQFNFKADENTTLNGFLAHEVADIVPEAISGEKDEIDEDGNIKPQGIDQSKLVPLMVKTIQELEARITELENAE